MSPLTKMLIVLQLVFSLVTSVVLTLYISKQENYKSAVDNANAGRTAAQAMATGAQAASSRLEQDNRNLQQQLTKVQGDRANEAAAASAQQSKTDTDLLAAKAEASRLANQNTSLTAANAAATSSIAAKDAELADLRPKVAKLTTENADVSRAANEKENQLRAAELAIRKLQEQLAAAPAGGGAGAAAPNSAGGQVTVLSNAPTAAQINAKVGKVQQFQGRTLVELPLGTRDGLQVNSHLYVYRGNNFIADVDIVRVLPDTSVASVARSKPGETVQEGDMVSTIGQ